MPASESLTAALRRLILEQQSERRLPSVSAAVVQGGEIVWTDAVGLAGGAGEEAATPEHQYRIGSITKTFTAVAVMQLRDEGRLGLDDRLELHLPGARHGDVTLAAMLSHLSGLQREPPGEVWETLTFPTGDELVARLADAERVLAPGARWHYSNLAFALLGSVVAEVSGVPYERYLEERVLRPLRLERTTFEPVAPTTTPYLVEPYEDTLRAEPLLGGVEGIGPAGQLFSTAADLCRWAAFVADPKPEVLDPKTVEEMVAVRAIADLERWTLGWGLGFELYREGERILVGHGGAMPGFLACVAVSRKERTGAAVLTNASAGVDPELLARRLVLKTLELEPFEPGAWRPGAAPPPELAGVLGRWWSEGEEVVFRYLGGRLTAKAALAPVDLPPAVFEREEADRYRTVSGREQGELLRIVRDADGATVKLYWATYPFLREPTVFS